jgi:molybdenum cofactor guanylyltransferase
MMVTFGPERERPTPHHHLPEQSSWVGYFRVGCGVNPKANRVDAATYAVESYSEDRNFGLRQGRSPAGKVYDRGMDNPPAQEVTAFIMAGGKSTRMGMDKAFVNFDGRTLLARALDLGRSVAPDARIVGSRKKFTVFAPVVEDVFRSCGPLGGIHAALRGSLTELNLMLAVDMPFVTSAFLQYLISQARGAPEAKVVVPRGDGGWQPLCAVYRREFADAAEHALRAGRNKIDRLFDEVRTRVIKQEELEGAGFSLAIFRNLNTPEELEAERRRA